MNPQLAKVIIGYVAQAGAGHVVKLAVGHITPADASRLSKVGLWIGSVVIGGVLTNPVRDYTDETIDMAVELIDTVKSAAHR